MNRRRFLQQIYDRLRTTLALAAGVGITPIWATGPNDRLSENDAAEPTQPAPDGTLRLFPANDVMTGRGIDQALPHPGSVKIFENSTRNASSYLQLAEQASGPIPRPVDFECIWGEALEQLALMAPAVRLINLETSITTSDDAWPDKAIHYRMNPANTPCLAAARIDGRSGLANCDTGQRKP